MSVAQQGAFDGRDEEVGHFAGSQTRGRSRAGRTTRSSPVPTTAGPRPPRSRPAGGSPAPRAGARGTPSHRRGSLLLADRAADRVRVELRHREQDAVELAFGGIHLATGPEAAAQVLACVGMLDRARQVGEPGALPEILARTRRTTRRAIRTRGRSSSGRPSPCRATRSRLTGSVGASRSCSATASRIRRRVASADSARSRWSYRRGAIVSPVRHFT